MPRFAGKRADMGVPVTIEKDRYVEGDVDATMEGSVALGEKPGNVTFPVQLDEDGYLKTHLSAGGYAEHEYQDGDLNTSAYGRLFLGDDGANLQNISVDTAGHLQVDVLTGAYDGVQYQDGSAVGSPFGYVMLGHDGSNVFPVVTDADGYLQVDIRSLPADTFAAENAVLGKGVLVQGDDGTDRHNIAVDTNGNVQVDVVDEPKASILNNSVDVTLVATSTTQIVGMVAARFCVSICNLPNNTQTFRIGDASTGATSGAILEPGDSISIETTEAIYGYNPGGSGEAVSVIWTED